MDQLAQNYHYIFLNKNEEEYIEKYIGKEVEVLIERINKIQDTIPKHEETESEEEKAFNDAIEEQYMNMRRGLIKKQYNRR